MKGVVYLLCFIGLQTICAEPVKFKSNAGTTGFLMSMSRIQATHGNGEPPKFCNKLDCPVYEVIEKHRDYELREYESTMWATTAVKGIAWESATHTMFMRLFRFIQGANSKGEKIEMTVPVKVRVIPGQGAACENDFTMSFFMSPKLGNIPKPTDKSVKIEVAERIQVYVRSYPGFSTKEKMLSEVEKLAAEVDPTKYDSSYFYQCGYDSPFKFFNRHNEIWLVKK